MADLSLIQSYLKRKKISVTKLVELMGIGRNTFYYQLEKDVEDIDDDFKAGFKKITGDSLESIFEADLVQMPNRIAEPVAGYSKTLPYKQDIVTPRGFITSVNQNRRNSNALIPFYNADFMAGAAEVYYEDGTIYPEYYMDVPEFAGCTAFRAYSDSMEKIIRSGSILFGVKVDDWQSHLELGQIYGITTTDFRRYLKYIRANKEDHTKFLLKSENPDYDDFTIPKSKIKNIWLIEGWLDKRT